MSVLKFQVSLRYAKQQIPCSYFGVPFPICIDKDCTQCISSQQNSTFQATITKRFHTDDADRKQTEPSTALSQSNVNSGASFDRKQKILAGLMSIGIAIPHKISEINNFLTDASKKIMSLSQDALKGNNVKRESKKEKVDVQESSLEKTVIQINQSIVSFYDTSCVKDMPPAPKSSSTYTMYTHEVHEDEHQYGEATKAIGPLFPITPNADAKKKKAEARRAEKISRLSLESRTKSLVHSLKSAHSLMSKITRTEELCEHLIAHPECVWEATSERVVPCLLSLLKCPDKVLQGLAMEALSLLGYCKPLTSPGIRVLSIDGGGTKGLVAIEFLKALEKQTNRRIYQLFDYVCGVSTGALLAAMVCLYKIPLDRCEELYKDCSVQMFTRNKVVGTTKLVWNHGFYDSQSWEEILKKEIGERLFIEFSRDPDVPKMSAASTLVNSSELSNYLFRTYNLPPGVTSQYRGSCKYKIWEVIRASSAAPGYFDSFTLDEDIHEDGGILTNNPTALAIHECRLLWPNEQFHCIVSLGTGRSESKTVSPGKVTLKQKISTLVNSATDTESVHHTLQDLLQPRTYFRFNPYLSEEFSLDEIRPEKIAQMQLDSQMYTRRNSYKLIAASDRLTEKRKPQQYIYDLIRKMAQQA
ncbi:calcium-independent phospholipase A2-gamma-like [Biomphalaria glabrata]|uniref:Calcium-independent phospholipase A2-gamma-like n=1 Tax=Biomphalaria glabrata TaxID=6526 RepID=A0A9U8E5N8_BIOGL|nr:calcium-independent phospholipase A2-gamma-like [Biomphalaria glabrata]